MYSIIFYSSIGTIIC